MAHVLFVEDDADVRTVFVHVLRDAGHKVDATATVSGGMDFLNRRDYDIWSPMGVCRMGLE